MTTGKRGQVLTFYAIVLPIVLLPLAAYTVNVAFVSTRAASLEQATAQAAEAAAQQLDIGVFRSRSVLKINALAARAVATHAMGDSERGAAVESVVVVGSSVTVSTREVIILPFDFLPVPAIVLHARASARIVAGYDKASSRLPLPINNF
jgi:Flp pilus assembly protein TadG